MTTIPEIDPRLIEAEFCNAPLGDARLVARLTKVATALARSPTTSLRRAMKSRDAEDAAYRFCSNDNVTTTGILEPHQRETVKRITHAEMAIAIHDTTEFAFGGEPREGLGRLGGSSRQGFYGHVTFAVTYDATHRSLGVLGFTAWARTEPKKRRPGDKRLNGDAYQDDERKESNRWFEQVSATEDAVGSRGLLIHVADREADSFVLFESMLEHGYRFVIRAARNRLAREEESDGKLRELVARKEDIYAIEVPLSPRKAKGAPRANETSGARNARVAKLGVRAAKCELLRPRRLGEERFLSLNAVEVHEIDAPEGVDPVNWLLLTSEPIETPADVHAVIETYRARWGIEEFFKALKTGFEIEKSQLDSFKTLTSFVAICCPLAWQALLLRNLSRTQPDAPATDVLTPTQIDVLRACGSMRLEPVPLMRTALFAVAALGGHHNKKEPGWLTLGRGLQELLILERGWVAAQRFRGEM